MIFFKRTFKQRIEDWERGYINTITMQMMVAATSGTLVAALLAFILRKFSTGEISPEILFIPWGIALVLGISSAFHQGVLAERNRILKLQAGPPKEDEPKDVKEDKKEDAKADEETKSDKDPKSDKSTKEKLKG